MELSLHRIEFNNISTIGKLYKQIDNGDDFICDTLEDKDRGLKDEWELATIIAKKEFGKTAIPTGRYEVVINFSEHFQMVLPEIVGVKGFAGIRIHSGNDDRDTEGCVLTGEYVSDDWIKNSRQTFQKVFKLIGDALLNERVFITVGK